MKGILGVTKKERDQVDDLLEKINKPGSDGIELGFGWKGSYRN